LTYFKPLPCKASEICTSENVSAIVNDSQVGTSDIIGMIGDRESAPDDTTASNLSTSTTKTKSSKTGSESSPSPPNQVRGTQPRTPA
jgi:hypothetical protein